MPQPHQTLWYHSRQENSLRSSPQTQNDSNFQGTPSQSDAHPVDTAVPTAHSKKKPTVQAMRIPHRSSSQSSSSKPTRKPGTPLTPADALRPEPASTAAYPLTASTSTPDAPAPASATSSVSAASKSKSRGQRKTAMPTSTRLATTSAQEQSLQMRRPSNLAEGSVKAHNAHKHEREWEEKYRLRHADELARLAQARSQPLKRTAAQTAHAPSPSQSESTKTYPDVPPPNMLSAIKAPPSLWSTSKPEGGYSTFRSANSFSPPSESTSQSSSSLDTDAQSRPKTDRQSQDRRSLDQFAFDQPYLSPPKRGLDSHFTSQPPLSPNMTSVDLRQRANQPVSPTSASKRLSTHSLASSAASPSMESGVFPGRNKAGRPPSERAAPDTETKSQIRSTDGYWPFSIGSDPSILSFESDAPSSTSRLGDFSSSFPSGKGKAPAFALAPAPAHMLKHAPSLPSFLSSRSDKKDSRMRLHLPHFHRLGTSTAPGTPVRHQAPQLPSTESLSSLTRSQPESRYLTSEAEMHDKRQMPPYLEAPLEAARPVSPTPSSVVLLGDHETHAGSEDGSFEYTDSDSDYELHARPETGGTHNLLPSSASLKPRHTLQNLHSSKSLDHKDFLLGSAAKAGASRRPPEYDTGEIAGKGSKLSWAPWKHSNRSIGASGDESLASPVDDEKESSANSLILHARFAVLAVSGTTLLTAYNHKVKIFRSGAVRAELALPIDSGVTNTALGAAASKGDTTPGLSPGSTANLGESLGSRMTLGGLPTDSAPGRASENASSQSPKSLLNSPPGATTEKPVAVHDSDLAVLGRVTALCFLQPCSSSPNEPAVARYAWVGTSSGTLWELDVINETRTSANSTVHHTPIVRIARMGARVLVVDEGGKISIWSRTGTRTDSAMPASPSSKSCSTIASSPHAGGSSVSINTIKENSDTASSSLDTRGDASSIRSLRMSAPEKQDKMNLITSTRLLHTRPATLRFPVEGKKWVPLLVGDQLWIATGGVQSGAYHPPQPGSAAQGSGHKKHPLHRLGRGVFAAVGADGNHDHRHHHYRQHGHHSHSDQQNHLASAPVVSDIRIHIYNPFADERPSTSPTTPLFLPAILSDTEIGTVTASAVVPSSTCTVFLSHATGHISEWSRSRYQCVALYRHSQDPILCLTAAGRYLWAGTKGGKLLVFGLDTAHSGRDCADCESRSSLVLIKSWVAHGGKPITRVVTDPDGISLGRLQVVSGGLDGAVRVWDGLLTHDWFERRLHRADHDVSSHRTIRTLHVTYNIDAAHPKMLQNTKGGDANRTFLLDLLRSAGRAPPVTMAEDAGRDIKPEGPEIIVFGLQELINLEDKRLTAKSILLGKKKWGNELGERISSQYAAWRTTLADAVAETFGQGKYQLVLSELLVGLMTCVFVSSREVKAGHMSEAAVGTVKTGLFGGRYGNKGAVAARVVLDDTSLCFVNCHLAAGQDHVRARNTDASTILDATKLFPRTAAAAATPLSKPNISDGKVSPAMRRALAFTRGGDGEQVFDHDIVFWSGDLNYRVDLERGETLSYLTSGNIAALLDSDQLGEQMRHNANFALRAFHEAQITFPPTYKFNQLSSRYDTSAKQRVPAWCDRILFADTKQTFPATCVREHDAQDDFATETALGPVNVASSSQSPLQHQRPNTRAEIDSIHHARKSLSVTTSNSSSPEPGPRSRSVEGYAYRSWPATISDHRPVSSQFDIQVKHIDPPRLSGLLPRIRQEWALVQANQLEEARSFYQSAILG